MRAIRFARILTVMVVGLLCMPSLALSAAIKGKVVFVGAVPPAKKVDITIDQYVCGTAKDAGDLVLSPQKELRNAVVWIENPSANAGAPAQTEKIEMDQNGCVFI
ncbi:MAG: hypothetical protein E6G75_22035, partial [Alphaproteobacteria bacterium]